MALRQGQRNVRVYLIHINLYLYNHGTIAEGETVVGADVKGDEVIFLVEKKDAQEG